MEFKDFLMKEYKLGEKSARDYVTRFNGIVERGIYKGESQVSLSMETAIQRELEKKSRGHYLLALKRYLEFKEKNLSVEEY
jgi:hypothetical protein